MIKVDSFHPSAVSDGSRNELYVIFGEVYRSEMGQFFEEVIIYSSKLVLFGIEDVEDMLRLECLGQCGQVHPG